jgi:hypothetical protein
MDAVRKLRRLNFADLLLLEHPDVAAYGYGDYKANGHHHPKIVGYCIECERKGCHISVQEPAFSLKNISHGAHTTDFLVALRETVDVTGWHDEPILFVYEAPSLDYGIYEPVTYEQVTKRPTKDWYWIHHDQDVRRFPDSFTGGTYGDFVLSAILTFRLKNAYMTNLVKCGLNTDDGQQFRGLASFQPTCVQLCVDRYLRREIEILEPRVIFAVGAAVYNWVASTVRSTIPTHQLPHPAGGRRGFKNAYFRVLYFWLVALALHKAEIIQSTEAEDLARTFIRDYREP